MYDTNVDETITDEIAVDEAIPTEPTMIVPIDELASLYNEGAAKNEAIAELVVDNIVEPLNNFLREMAAAGLRSGTFHVEGESPCALIFIEEALSRRSNGEINFNLGFENENKGFFIIIHW